MMIRELLENHFALPAITHYNAIDIPFAYPPLGLYVAAIVSALTRLSVVDVLRVVPLTVTALSVGAFFFLARAMLPRRPLPLVATLIYSVLPMSYGWLLMGGGVTRGFGNLFAILALREAYLFLRDRQRLHGILLTILLSATILSHPENGFFVAYSVAYLALMLRRWREAALLVTIVGAATVALTSPWWLTVMLRHGLSPFIALGQTGAASSSGLVSLLTLRLTGETVFPVVGCLALLGVLAKLGRRDYLLPGWVLVIFVVQQRAPDQRAVLPLAMLAAIGLLDVVIPLLEPRRKHASETLPVPRQYPRAAVMLTIATLLAIVTSVAATRTLLRPLSPDERTAMAWVSTGTPLDSRFLVITGDYWAADRSAEWFPVLTMRTSLNTVQGTEWRTDFGFLQQRERNEALQKCAAIHIGCIVAWAAENNLTFTHLYVAKRPNLVQGDSERCCQAVLMSLRESDQFVQVFDGEGAAVYELLPQPRQ